MTITDVAADDRSIYKLLTVIDAADYLSLSRGAIYNLLSTEAITSIHIGRARHIPSANSNASSPTVSPSP